MNTKNNKRRKESQTNIEKTFIDLLDLKDVSEITITDICKRAKLNRSTFYANYLDIYDLVEKIENNMISEFKKLYEEEHRNNFNSNNFLKLFYHIKENQTFYQAFFKLQFDMNYKIYNYDTNLALKYYDNKYIEYHMEFFRAGITSIVKKWLENDCDLSPETLFEIIKEEYNHKV